MNKSLVGHFTKTHHFYPLTFQDQAAKPPEIQSQSEAIYSVFFRGTIESPIKAAWMLGVLLCLIAIILLACKVLHLSTHHIHVGTPCYWCAFPSLILQYVWNNSEGNDQPTQPHLKPLFTLLAWDLEVAIVLWRCRCFKCHVHRDMKSKLFILCFSIIQSRFPILVACQIGSHEWNENSVLPRLMLCIYTCEG